MDEPTEKYPVCPQRNVAAAYRRFFQPLSAVELLKARMTRQPAAANLPAAPRAGAHRQDR
jgi:hypothetical protein